MYTPTTPVVFHDYRNSMSLIKSPNADIDFFEWQRNGMSPENRKFLFDNSVKRINALYLHEVDSLEESVLQLGKYGLGTKRSVQQFLEFTGINVQKKQVFGARYCFVFVWFVAVVNCLLSLIDCL